MKQSVNKKKPATSSKVRSNLWSVQIKIENVDALVNYKNRFTIYQVRRTNKDSIKQD